MDASALANAESWLSIIGTAKLVAAFLVAIGVAIEFGGDWVAKPFEKVIEDARKLEFAELHKQSDDAKLETARLSKEAETARSGIADANARALEARLELERFKAPRTISDDQKKALVANLKALAGTEFDAATNMNDKEQSQLLRQLMGILIEAGWKQVGWKYVTGGPMYKFGTFENSSPDIGMVTVYDVEIQVREEAFARLQPAAEALMAGLNDIGIATHGVKTDARDVNSANVQTYHLIVGQKR
jgi:hypothetical protein